MFGYKLTIHPLYFCLCLYYIVIGKAWVFFSSFVTVLLHEIAHGIAGKKYGYQMSKITLMPYGAMIYGGEKFNRKEGIMIAFAGPLCNGILALFTIALWWLLPESFAYTQDFLNSNLTLMFFNLLPCFPLDGSRVVLSLCGDKIKALKILKIVGVILSILIIGLGIASIFVTMNISIINIGVFLLIGAIFGGQKEEYSCIAGRLSFVKNYKRGVLARDVYISQDTKIFELFRYLNRDYLTTFIVVNDRGQDISVVDEDRLHEIMEKFDHKLTLKEVVFI